MKKLLFIVMLAGAQLSLRAQEATPAAKQTDILTFKEYSFNFGNIQQSHPVTHEFELTNVSADTVKLQNVQASCGCTTPVWKKEPIAPGASTVINVGYNAAAEGPFDKLITIYYNGGQIKTISIKGTVVKASTTPARPNSSIQLLKQTNQ